MINAVRFFFLTLFWGFSFIAIHKTLEHVPPLQAAILRMSIAAVFLSIVALVRRDAWFSRSKDFFACIAIGVFSLGIPWACLFWGEQYVQPAVASIVNSSVPIFTLLFSMALLPNEKYHTQHFVGVALGFIGIVFVFIQPLLSSNDFFKLKGLFAIFIMAVSYGLGTTLIRKIGSHIPPMWSMLPQAIGGCAIVFPFSILAGEKWQFFLHAKTHSSLFSVLYLGVFSTAIAWVLFFRLIHNWGPLRAATVTFTVPLVAIAIDALYLKQIPHMFEILGITIIFSGIAVINGLIELPKKDSNLSVK